MERKENIWDFKPRQFSVIKYLRKKYPNECWKARRAGFGYWVYENVDGELAWWSSSLAPRYDGDDDSFTSSFHIYRKTGAERVWFDDLPRLEKEGLRIE